MVSRTPDKSSGISAKDLDFEVGDIDELCDDEILMNQGSFSVVSLCD